MPARFINKTVVVTGASSGLGRCLSLRLAAEGARLILFARNEEKLRATARACLEKMPSPKKHGRHEPVVVTGDITRMQDCQRLAQAVAQNGGVDYLLNCAGISMWMRFADMQELDALERLMQTNYFGVVRLIHCLLPQLQQRRGLICAISSLQGHLPTPYHSGYAASKHALDGFLNSLRLEQPGMDILIVHPAWISGTELRDNALGDAPSGTQSKSGSFVTVEDCTTQVLRAMHRRCRDLTVPSRYRFLPLLYAACPAFLERIIRRRVHKQLPPSKPDR